MKRITKKAISVIASVLIILSVAFSAFAALYPDITAKSTRIGAIATGSTGCSAMEGLSVTASGSNKRLFVVKVSPDDSKAMLYMYKDYTTMDNSSDDEYGRFTLSGFVGHANGMAIDDNYIYITGWNSETGENGNKIVRIKRSMLWSKYKSTTSIDKGTLTASSDGCTMLPAVYSDGRTYDRNIKSITYYKNGQFIIGYPIKNNSEDSELFEGVTLDTENKDYLSYTTAKVVDGKFVINNSKNDVFRVSFAKGSTGQDIGYDANCGLFIARWLGGAKNSIIWVRLNSLSGENRIYESDNSKYRIIKLNKSSNVFQTYELESVSIGSDNCMYANVNVKVTDSDKYSKYVKDAIIKIERPEEAGGSTNFLGSYFTQ